MRQLHFYGLHTDLLPMLETVERDGPLQYVRTGYAPTQKHETFQTGLLIPDLGKPNAASAVSAQTFLVAVRDAAIKPRLVKTRAGAWYAMDQQLNPHTIVLAPGGLWEQEVVLSGRVATASDSAVAQELMRRFRSAFKKGFRKIQAYSVETNALALLIAGKRLTPAVQSPREYDLTMPQPVGRAVRTVTR